MLKRNLKKKNGVSKIQHHLRRVVSGVKSLRGDTVFAISLLVEAPCFTKANMISSTYPLTFRQTTTLGAPWVVKNYGLSKNQHKFIELSVCC